MLAPEVETRPSAEQLALDDAAYRAQLAYLLRALGLLPREARRGGRRVRRGGRRARRHRAAAAHREAASSGRRCTPENPIGAHLCADADRDRPHLLDERHDRHAELHPADRGRPRQLGDRLGAQLRRLGRRRRRSAIVSTYNAGPFVAGAALAAFDRIGLCHIPVGTGNTERLMRAIELLQPEAAVLTPSYAAYLVEWAAERGFDLRGSSVERVLVAGEPGGGEPAFRAQARGGLGRAGHRGDGHRRHRRLALGRVRGAGRHAPRRARLRPRRADRPRDRRARSSWRTAPPASSSSRTSGTARRRCCASARATTSRSGPRPAPAAAPARACAASGAPTTC